MSYQILRWVPAVLLAATFSLLWGTATRGGEQGVLAWLLLRGGLPYLGGTILLGMLVYFIWKRRVGRWQWATVLLAIIAMWPALWGVWPLALRYPVSIDRLRPATTVRLPTDAPLQVTWGGDTVWVNAHAAFPDQRWAYDLVVDPALSGSDRLADYGCWGVPVVAPVAGTVVVAVDGERDQPPGQESRGYGHPAGNHVFIELATGTYLAIGHLQRGSVAVQAGDPVAEGQVIGRCGNSGSTSEPHIHIHHQRQHPEASPAGIAEGLPLYFRDHDGPPMPTGGYRLMEGAFALASPVLRHTGR